jgi:GNAT superfamily N-acetyltransferase
VIELRFLKEADLPAASELCIRAKAHWGYDPTFIDLCIPDLRIEIDDLASSELVGAYKGEQLIGVLQLVLKRPDVLLDKLFVEPELIGLGVGRQLFRWAVQKSKEWQARKIVIESDPHAEPAYLAFGCKKVGEVRAESTERTLPLLEYHLTYPRMATETSTLDGTH